MQIIRIMIIILSDNVLYVVPVLVDHILGKLPLVPFGDTGTIPHHLRMRTWRPQAGCWRWMQVVVCQLVGNGVVQ
jgi:hypothetical protein